jgi:hypothetical protein
VRQPRPKRCVCGGRIAWARNDDGVWVEVDAQAALDRTVPDPVVVWAELGAGEGVQRVSSLADFEAAHGAHLGPVWRLHFSHCPEADKPIELAVSARGRKLLAILQAARPRRKGGRP